MKFEEGNIILQEIRQLASWRLQEYCGAFLQLQFPDDNDVLSVRLVHRLRVICRRIRAGLNNFQLVFPEEKFKLMNDGFRDFARWFSEIRDIDVLLEELVELTGQTEPFQQDDVMLKAIEMIGAKRRYLVSQVIPKTTAFFDGEASSLLSSFIKENQMVQPERLLNSAYVREFIVESIRTKVFNFRSYEEILNTNHFNAEFHQMRIALKNLRYSIDLFSCFDVQSFNTSIELFQTLQDQMGEIHDTVVWPKMIDLFLGEAEESRESTSQGAITSEESSALKLYWNRRATGLYQQFCKSYQELKTSGFWEELDRSLTSLRNLE